MNGELSIEFRNFIGQHTRSGPPVEHEGWFYFPDGARYQLTHDYRGELSRGVGEHPPSDKLEMLRHRRIYENEIGLKFVRDFKGLKEVLQMGAGDFDWDEEVYKRQGPSTGDHIEDLKRFAARAKIAGDKVYAIDQEIDNHPSIRIPRERAALAAAERARIDGENTRRKEAYLREICSIEIRNADVSILEPKQPPPPAEMTYAEPSEASKAEDADDGQPIKPNQKRSKPALV